MTGEAKRGTQETELKGAARRRFAQGPGAKAPLPCAPPDCGRGQNPRRGGAYDYP
jgi:hypothetical protein